MKVMDKILLILSIALSIFIIAMIVIYCKTGGIPDTLVTCVFAVCGGECGAMAWIKTSKERNKERLFELQDRKLNKEENSDVEEIE